MLRIFINLIILIIGMMVVLNIMPNSLKEKALGLISSIIPDFLEEKIEEKLEPIILTPTERRAKLIDELETNISELKTTVAKKNIKPAVEIIEKTEEIVKKIEEANEEPGPINKAATTIIKKAADIFKSEKIRQPADEPPHIIQNKPPNENSSCRWICQ